MWYNQRLIRLGGFSLMCYVDTILLTVNKSVSNGWIISMVFNCRWIHPHTWSPGGWHGLVWMGPPQFESGSVSSWGYFQHQSVSPETHHSSGLQTPGGPVWRTVDGLRNRLILSEMLWKIQIIQSDKRKSLYIDSAKNSLPYLGSPSLERLKNCCVGSFGSRGSTICWNGFSTVSDILLYVVVQIWIKKCSQF